MKSRHPSPTLTSACGHRNRVGHPLAQMENAEFKIEKAVMKDLKLLARFVELYCHDHHSDEPRGEFRLKGYDVQRLHGSALSLCAECRKLLAHAFVKRTVCPMDPKPICRKCPEHCYAPSYRARIREVMKHSGRKLVLRGRLDYLFHLIG